MEDPGDFREEIKGDAAVHEERFRRVAGGVALGLGVVGDAHGHLEVARIVHVGVADPLEVLDHRDGRLRGEPGDEALAAARNEDVDLALGADEGAHEFAVAALEHLHALGRELRFRESVAHEGGEEEIRSEGLRAAAKQNGVSGLDGERRRVDRHVRARFVDHGEDAERHAHAAHDDARRLGHEVFHAADRIGQRRDLTAARRHRGDRFFREGESVEEGFVAPGDARGFHVLGVDAQNFRGVPFNAVGEPRERFVARGRGAGGQRMRSGARGRGELTDDFLRGGHGSARRVKRRPKDGRRKGRGSAGEKERDALQFHPRVGVPVPHGEALDQTVDVGTDV